MVTRLPPVSMPTLRVRSRGALLRVRVGGGGVASLRVRIRSRATMWLLGRRRSRLVVGLVRVTALLAVRPARAALVLLE